MNWSVVFKSAVKNLVNKIHEHKRVDCNFTEQALKKAIYATKCVEERARSVSNELDQATKRMSKVS